MGYCYEEKEVVQLTKKLIEIPSENPIGSEKECALFVRDWLTAAGASVFEAEVYPERKNIVATVKGKGSRPPLIILAHMDTVPAGEGWDVEPFAGVIKDNKLFGRGATDMKGGLAAAMMAMKNIIKSGYQLQGDFILCATVDEEGPKMGGGMHFAESGLITEDAMVIATEPTRNKLCLAQKGVMWYRIDVEGKMSHAGNAQLGADANHALAWIINELKQRVVSMGYQHPLLGDPTITVGKMVGGIKTNVVPNHAYAEIDFRLVPPITCKKANELLSEVCQEVSNAVAGTKAKVENLGLQRPPIEVKEGSPVVQALQKGHLIATGSNLEVEGFPAYTDAGVAFLITGNKQCVLFGPGDLDIAHTVNEYVSIEDLIIAENVLTETVKVALG